MAAPGAIRAGRAFVEIFADDSKARKVLDRFERRMKAWSSVVSGFGKTMMMAGTAILAPLTAAAAQFSTVGDQFDKMAGRTGASVEALSELSFAASRSGSDIATLEGSLRQMQRVLGEAANGGSAAVQTLQRLGLSISDLAELQPDQQFEAIADRLSMIKSPAERAAMAMKVFGRQGTALLPLMADGAAGIRALREEARGLNLTISGEDASAAAALADAWGDLLAVVKKVGFAIGAALGDGLKRVLSFTTKAVSATTLFIEQNRELVQSIAAFGLGLVAAGGAVMSLGAALWLAGMAAGGLSSLIGLAGTAVSGLIAMAGALPAVFAAVLSPVGLLALAIGSLGAYMLHSSGVIESAITRGRQLFAGLSADAIVGWQGIVDAVMAGDLGLAFELITATFNSLWTQAVAYVRGLWADMTNFANQVFIEATSNISGMFIRAFYSVQSAWTETVSAVSSLWDRALATIRTGWQNITRWIAGIATHVMAALGVDIDVGAVQKELDAINRQELDGIAATSAARQDAIQKDRADRLAAIDAERQGALEANEEIRQQRRESADSARDDELSALQDRVRAARQELDAKAKTAARRRMEAEMAVVGVQSGRDRTGGLAGSEVLGDARSSVIGTFSARAASGMSATTDYGQRIADGVSKTNELLSRIRKEGGAHFN